MARPFSSSSYRRRNRSGTKGNYIYYDKYPQRKRRALPSKHKTQYLIALRDPFNPKAYGVRIPDTNTVPSQSFYALDTSNVTGATNGVSYLICPSLHILGSTGTPTGVGTWTWGATYSANTIGAASIKTAALANYSATRPVAHGVKISATQSVTNATGTVHVCYCPVSQYGLNTWGAPTTISLMQRQNGYQRIPLSSLTQKPLILVNKPMDVLAQRYSDPAGNFPAAGGEGELDFLNQWCCIIVHFEGPTNAVIVAEMEYLTHYEGIVNSFTASIVPTGTDAEPYDPTVLGAAAHSLAVSSLVINEDKDWDAIAVKALDTFESAMQGVTGGYAMGGIPGAVFGGVWGAARGYTGRSRQGDAAAQRRRRRAATSSVTDYKRLLKF